MSQVINSNIASLNAQRNLTSSQSSLATSLQRLSSGLRINSAKDDAAGLAIASRMSSQIAGLNQATRNANDGISLVQTGDSALSEITNNLQRIRELAVQAANSTNSASDRAALQAEVDQRLQEIDRTASTTSFNGQKILDGSFNTANFQIGANAGEVISVGMDASARLSATGKIATTTSVGALGANASGSTYEVAANTFAFGTASNLATVGSAAVTPATRNFGTAAQSFIGGRTTASTVAATDFSQAGQALTSGKVEFTATDRLFAPAVAGSTASVVLSGGALATNFSVAGQALVEGTNVQTIGNGAGSNTQNAGGASTANYTGGGLGAAAITVDGHVVNLTADYSGVGGEAQFQTDLNTALNGFGINATAAGGTVTFTRAAATATQAIAVSADAVAQGAGFAASTAGTGTVNATAFDFSGAGLAQFDVTGVGSVTLNTDTVNESGLAAAIQAQLTGVTVTGVNGSGTLTFTRTGSETALAIASTDQNGVLAGFADTAGTAGQAYIATTNATFSINGGDGAAAITLNSAAAGTLNQFITNVNTAIQNSALFDKVNYVAVANATNDGFVIQHNGSTNAVNITAADANAQAAGLPGVVTAGTAGSVTNDPVTFTIDAGGPHATAVTLNANYASYDDMRDAIDAQLADANFTVTNTAGAFTITRADTSGAASTGINITGDAAADAAGISLGETSTAGQNLVARTISTFTVGSTSVTLDQNYGNRAGVLAALQAQVGGDYDVTDSGTAYTFTSTASSSAVAIDADALTANGAAAAALGFVDSVGVAGQAAVTTTNASFTIDGLNITLDADYASFDAMATALQTKMNTAALTAGPGATDTGSRYAVTNDNGSLTISRSLTGASGTGITLATAGAGSTAVAITAVGAGVAGANATAAGLGVNAGVAGIAANNGTNATFTVDGHEVALTTNYASYDDLAANGTTGIEDQLNALAGAGAYTVTNTGGTLTITNNTTGSAAATIAYAGDIPGTNASTSFDFAGATATDGVAGGSIALSNLTINGVSLTSASPYASASALAAEINKSVSGVYASVGNDGKMTLASAAEITMTGSDATGTMQFGSATVAATSGSLADVSVATAEGANLAISRIDSALTSVNEMRGTFGAIQNRFDSAIASLQASSENTAAARSRIQDTDFAQETANMTRNQILQQAGVAMLAQANQLPQMVLSLLK